jgi:hypothetical protein
MAMNFLWLFTFPSVNYISVMDPGDRFFSESVAANGYMISVFLVEVKVMD